MHFWPLESNFVESASASEKKVALSAPRSAANLNLDSRLMDLFYEGIVHTNFGQDISVDG